MSLQALRGDDLFARALRSSTWTACVHVLSQAIRLGSNLVLTRLLFPDAFGLMALVMVAMVGLACFSDLGLGPAIMQSRRGDDRSFLDTAWTIQVIRGSVLFLATCALAVPVSRFYGEPSLADVLPVAGLSLLIGGFNPTKIETANRHLLLGRVMFFDLVSQVIGVAIMIALAVATGSVWSLVLGGVASAVSKLALTTYGLPGPVNRFRWEAASAGELVHFGKWIFLSTVCGFIITQGDRLILGKYLTLEMLGVYNIGYFLASFPIALAGAVVSRVLIPLYRGAAEGEADAGRNLRVMRAGFTGMLVLALALLALLGGTLIEILYDARYELAGPIVTLVALAQMPSVLAMTYDKAALANGDSRRFFFVLAAKASLFTALFLSGTALWGVVGALAGQGLAHLLSYPLSARLARTYGKWDPVHDAAFGAAGAGVVATALWLNWDAIGALALAGAP